MCFFIFKNENLQDSFLRKSASLLMFWFGIFVCVCMCVCVRTDNSDKSTTDVHSSRIIRDYRISLSKLTITDVGMQII